MPHIINMSLKILGFGVVSYIGCIIGLILGYEPIVPLK